MHKQAEAQLLALIDQERNAIMSGNFKILDDLTVKKTTLFELLAVQKTTPDQLRQIQSALGYNEKLLAAAIAGVNAARTRLAALREVKDELRVYTAKGQLAPAPFARQGMNKRS